MSVIRILRPAARAGAIAALAVVAFGSRVSGAAVMAGPVVNPSNGHTYYLLTTDTWTASETAAVLLGGQLATVRSLDENAWIFNTFANPTGVRRSLWIGLNDAASQTTYVWADGEPVDFTNWSATQPDNKVDSQGRHQDYVRIIPNTGGFTGAVAQFWDDEFNYTAGSYGVVEIVPEASVVPWASPAALLLLRSQRRPR